MAITSDQIMKKIFGRTAMSESAGVKKVVKRKPFNLDAYAEAYAFIYADTHRANAEAASVKLNLMKDMDNLSKNLAKRKAAGESVSVLKQLKAKGEAQVIEKVKNAGKATWEFIKKIYQKLITMFKNIGSWIMAKLKRPVETYKKLERAAKLYNKKADANDTFEFTGYELYKLAAWGENKTSKAGFLGSFYKRFITKEGRADSASLKDALKDVAPTDKDRVAKIVEFAEKYNSKKEVSLDVKELVWYVIAASGSDDFVADTKDAEKYKKNKSETFGLLTNIAKGLKALIAISSAFIKDVDKLDKFVQKELKRLGKGEPKDAEAEETVNLRTALTASATALESCRKRITTAIEQSNKAGESLLARLEPVIGTSKKEEKTEK